MRGIKEGSWLDDLVAIYNEVGGEAPYSLVYRLAEKRRKERGASWTKHARASIRRTVEDNAVSSANFRGRAVFYSVNGHGSGVWALQPEYLKSDDLSNAEHYKYASGTEGIANEYYHLRRSRNPRLVEARKKLDDYRCQVCGYRAELPSGHFIIDVHHLNPLAAQVGEVLTTIDDLVCLCPNCHRVAHTRVDSPLSLDEIAHVVESAAPLLV